MPPAPISAPSEEEVVLGLLLITEEFIELLRDGFGVPEGVTTHIADLLARAVYIASLRKTYDPVGAVDALADLDVVINRFGGILGFDMNEASRIVYESNMSKFTYDLEMAQRAQLKYQSEGRTVDIEENLVERDGTQVILFVVKDANTGKILKVTETFKDPDFSSMMGD